MQRTQRAAQASPEWFENIGSYADQDDRQFVFNLLTRSRRITFDNLGDRDAEFASMVETRSAESVPDGSAEFAGRPRMLAAMGAYVTVHIDRESSGTEAAP